MHNFEFFNAKARPLLIQIGRRRTPGEAKLDAWDDQWRSSGGGPGVIPGGSWIQYP